MELIGALFAGAFIGAILGYVGAGGAMLSVPILMYIFDFTPHQATTAALAIVFLAAASGVIPKIKLKSVLYRDALVISGIGAITNIGFSSISENFSEKFISTGFALVLVVAAISMVRGPIKADHRRMPLGTLILVSLIIGAMTGIFGIGGGFLAIPVLVLFFGTPQNIAAGTSLLIISQNSLIALLAHHSQWSSVAWSIPIAMAIGAVVVARIASRVGHNSRPEVTRRAFAGLLLAISIFTLVKTWLAH